MAAVQFGRPQQFILMLSIISKIMSEPIITTSCQDVLIGEKMSTSLEFTFTEEVDKLHKDFKVELYTNTLDTPIPVLLCHWSKEGYRDCYEYDGYKYGGYKGNTVTLNIPSASLENTGQYACVLLSYSKPGTYDKCTLTVEARETSSTSTTTFQAGNIIAAEKKTVENIQLIIILGTLMTVIIILLIVIIVLFKCRWKHTAKEGENSSKSKEHSSTSEEHSSTSKEHSSTSEEHSSTSEEHSSTSEEHSSPSATLLPVKTDTKRTRETGGRQTLQSKNEPSTRRSRTPV